MLHLVPLVTGLRPSSPWSGSHPRSRSLLRGGAAPRAELSFGSEADYESWLVAESPLPQGFRVATGGFSFVPQEAPIPSIMNLTMIVLDAPSEHFAACFTNNALCGSPITVGRKRLAESPALQAIVVNNKISNVCAPAGQVVKRYPPPPPTVTPHGQPTSVSTPADSEERARSNNAGTDGSGQEDGTRAASRLFSCQP